MDAIDEILAIASVERALNHEVKEINAMNHIFDKLDLVEKVVEEKYEKIEQRADAFLARAAEFDPKIDSAFAPHEGAMDAADKKLDQMEHRLDRLSNAPLPSSTTVANGSDKPTERPTKP